MNDNVRFLVKVLRWASRADGASEVAARLYCDSYQEESLKYEALSIHCEEMFNSTLILTDIMTPSLLSAQLSRNIEKHFFKYGERGSGTNKEKKFYKGVCDMLNKFAGECELGDE